MSLALSHPGPQHTSRAFTLVELLVVIGVIAILLSLFLPALSRARKSVMSTRCTSNLRELGRAAQLYANDSNGFVPRDHTPWRPDRRSYWLVQLGPYVRETEDWEMARVNPANADKLSRSVEVFQCPSHPHSGDIPGDFVVNAFRFQTDPSWDPDGPVILALVVEPSRVVYIAEAATQFGGGQSPNAVYSAEHHDVWQPEHLPGGAAERISGDRHTGKSNLLFFDGSVRSVLPQELVLSMFDDGIRRRGSPLVLP